MLKFVESKLKENPEGFKEVSSLRIEIRGNKILVNGKELDDDYLLIRRRGKYVDVTSGKSLSEALDKLSKIA